MVVLLVTTTLMYWQMNTGSSLDVDKDAFKVEGLDKVDRVVLESPRQKVELKFNGARWKVNDQYNADRGMIDVLFATLQQAEPKRPVAVRIQDSVSRELNESGTHVSLYAGTELKKKFTAGGDPQKKQAYFKDDGNTPYVMVIPGYSVYVSGILELDENGWRDKYVFGFNWRNFQQLEASFPTDPDNDFKIVMKDNRPEVEGIVQADTARLNDFLDNVSLLRADQFVNSGKDSLLQEKPLMHISVTDIASRQYKLAVYPNQVHSKNYPALVQDSLPAVFDQQKIRNILKPKSYFRKEQTP